MTSILVVLRVLYSLPYVVSAVREEDPITLMKLVDQPGFKARLGLYPVEYERSALPSFGDLTLLI